MLSFIAGNFNIFYFNYYIGCTIIILYDFKLLILLSMNNIHSDFYPLIILNQEMGIIFNIITMKKNKAKARINFFNYYK